MKKVVVVGSINMDLVTMCQRVPKAGETIFGDRFFQVPGGKGANQGVAMGKLGTKVSAIAVTRIGAQSSIPTLKEVNEFQGVKRS